MRATTDVKSEGVAGAQNLVRLLIDCARDPNKIGARQKVNGVWQDVSWGQILDQVKKLSAGLIAEGVKPGDRVAIFANTSLEWAVADLAINAARAVTVPIYGSNTPEEARYILDHSEATMVFVDSDEAEGKQPGRASRVRQKMANLPNLKKMLLFSGQAQGPREDTLAGMLKAGEAVHAKNPDLFEQNVSMVNRDDPAFFIYTSGTTGNPKAVILTHANWAYEAEAVRQIKLIEPGDTCMLFLPLAHSFAQVVKAAWLGMGFVMVFAESVDKLLANVAETHPTVLPAVPRVFEKVFNTVLQSATSHPGVKGRLARWAFGLFDEYAEAMSQGRKYDSIQFTLARRLVFSKVYAQLSEKLGGNMRLFISGGAPLSRKIAYFFDLLGFKVLEGYGLTETSAATCVNLPTRIKIGTVGPPVPGTEIQIAPDGEILMRGGGVMKGYYKNDEATREVLTPDGWFHSGDIGDVDEDGYVRITDRKKDIIVTAGGKNVAPQNIENDLKTHAIVSQAMVYGDKRKYLTALITVNEEAARKVLTDAGATPPATYADVAARPEVKAAVQAAVDAVNGEQPSYQTLKRFALMDHDFTQESGELTPTLKVKRKFATQKYKAILDALYDGETY